MLNVATLYTTSITFHSKLQITLLFSLCLLSSQTMVMRGNSAVFVKHRALSDDIAQPAHYSNATCVFRWNSTKGYCHCRNPGRVITNAVCQCSFTFEARENYLCTCRRQLNSTFSSQCRCLNLFRKLDNLNCTHNRKSNVKGSIKIGVIIPFSFGKEQITAYYSGAYYASAMYLAVDSINRDARYLPNHKLSLAWANSECDWKKSVKWQYKMIQDENVDAFIGGGCTGCEIIARNAGAFNLPMVSHMCYEPELSDKTKYPTFARTEPIGRQLTPAIKELLRHFHWEMFALVVEDSTRYAGLGLYSSHHLSKFISTILITKYQEKSFDPKYKRS